MSSSCPSKYLARAKDKAWITTALRKSSKIKSKLYKKLLEAIHHQDEIKYKQYKRTLRKVALEAEQLPGLATPLAPLKFWIAYLTRKPYYSCEKVLDFLRRTKVSLRKNVHSYLFSFQPHTCGCCGALYYFTLI